MHADTLPPTGRVVLGRLRFGGDSDPDARAEEVMHPGPTTVRVHEDCATTSERMTALSARSILVTHLRTSSGGVVRAAASHLTSTQLRD